MGIEAAILTGGASRRMGKDKATLPLDGVGQAKRIVDALAQTGIPVTTLGREPTAGAAFLEDAEELAGPVTALARFIPAEDFVFVASCDLPRFDARIVPILEQALAADCHACIPVSDGYRQPLCGLYRASAFDRLRSFAADGIRCPSRWLDVLDVTLLSEEELVAAGGDVNWTRGANTPEELAQLIGRNG